VQRPVLGYFDPVSDTITIYYVPGIGRGALGETYAPSGQAAVDNTRDYDGWTLFHELLRVLDRRKDGDFDLHNSPDVPNDVQSA
jgi:hypothetical protein